VHADSTNKPQGVLALITSSVETSGTHDGHSTTLSQRVVSMGGHALVEPTSGVILVPTGRSASMPRGTSAFMSYARDDDDNNGRQITKIRERLEQEVSTQLGEKFTIFQDRESITWGDNWPDETSNALDTCQLLIPVMTQRFFKSELCREEVEQFHRREQRLGRRNLIFPIYYADVAEYEDKRVTNDDILETLRYRERSDWRSLRGKPMNVTATDKIQAMARSVAKLIRTEKAAEPGRAGRPPPIRDTHAADPSSPPPDGAPADQANDEPVPAGEGIPKEALSDSGADLNEPQLGKLFQFPSAPARLAQNENAWSELLEALRTAKFDSDSWLALAAGTEELTAQFGKERPPHPTHDEDLRRLASELETKLASVSNSWTTPTQRRAACSRAELIRGWLVNMLS
jgi:hypothetical protein